MIRINIAVINCRHPLFGCKMWGRANTVTLRLWFRLYASPFWRVLQIYYFSINIWCPAGLGRKKTTTRSPQPCSRDTWYIRITSQNRVLVKLCLRVGGNTFVNGFFEIIHTVIAANLSGVPQKLEELVRCFIMLSRHFVTQRSIELWIMTHVSRWRFWLTKNC